MVNSFIVDPIQGKLFCSRSKGTVRGFSRTPLVKSLNFIVEVWFSYQNASTCNFQAKIPKLGNLGRKCPGKAKSPGIKMSRLKWPNLGENPANGVFRSKCLI